MSLWQRIKHALGFDTSAEDVASRRAGTGFRGFKPVDYVIDPDNGLPNGWHFVGLVDDNGKITHIDDSVTDQEIRNANRVFIAKTWPNGQTSHRQFSSADSKAAIGDMLIRESDEGSPI